MVIDLHAARPVIAADNVFVGLFQMTWGMDNDTLEEIAKYFERQAKDMPKGTTDYEELAQAVVFTAVATYARAMKEQNNR